MTEMSAAEAVFFAALAQGDPARRAACLDEGCGGDAELRCQVERLLAAHPEVGSFLRDDAAAEPADGGMEREVRGGATVDAPAAECPGTVIGPYKLLQQIGEGGMGTVYMAEQTQPVQRKVALKVIKPGMDSRHVIARFEAERQALAMMDHVSIARVFDGGTTDAGRPYFVMELVHGVPITTYCDDNHLTARERLELFVPLCQAIQHAHQKGIIHRDVKPSNVMVTLYDGKPVPKVIDFGVAKGTEQKLTGRTLFTQFGTMVGTLEYMSPEQAEISALGVDTRSDIYSLGVLLYELLTGTTPFDGRSIQAAGYDEMRRIIREEEPPKPSTRVSTLGPAAVTVSAKRQSDPRRLGQLFRGELDWIVMKALEKDRNRRYETANALAADVLHYLRDEPVQACPPSPWYRARKFVRRHKAGLATAAVLSLAVLIAVGSIGWLVGDHAERRSNTAREVGQLLARADELYRTGKLPEALAEVQKAQALLDAVAGGEAVRGEVRPWQTDLTTAAALEEIRLEWLEHADPVRTFADYARAFRRYGIDVEALPPEEAAGRIAASRIQGDLVAALDDGAWRLKNYSRSEANARLAGQLQAAARAVDLDPWGRRVREAGAAKDARALRALAASADFSILPVRSLLALGSALRTAGDLDTAVAFLRRVQRQYPENVRVNSALVECLNASDPRPPSEEAVGFLRAVVAARPKSGLARDQLARALAQRRPPEEAVAEYREAIRLSPNYLFSYHDLGWLLLHRMRDADGAIAVFTAAIDQNPRSALAWSARGGAYLWLGRLDQALADLDRAVAVGPHVASGWHGRGEVYRRLKRWDKAIANYSEAIRRQPEYKLAFQGRAEARLELRQFDQAAADFSRAIELEEDRRAKMAGRASPGRDTAALLGRGRAYAGLRQWDKVLADYSRVIELDPSADNWLRRAQVLEQLGRHDAAVADLSRAIERQPSWQGLWWARGDAYIGQGQAEKGLADYDRAIALDSRKALSWLFRGGAFRRLGRWGKAVPDFSKAIELDPRLADAWHSRGQAFHQLGQSDKALADYAKAIELMPTLTQAWSDRGMLHAELGRWREAAGDFARVVAAEPGQPTYWYDHAIAHLAAGDKEAYRAACAAMRERYRGTNDPATAGHVVSACVAAPEGAGDAAQLVALGGLAATQNPAWNTRLAGAAYYRANQPDRALGCLERPPAVHDVRAGDLLFRSMAHHRLGHAAEARACLTQAVRWIDSALPPKATSADPARPRWFNWQEQQSARRLRDEAEALLKGKGSDLSNPSDP